MKRKKELIVILSSLLVIVLSVSVAYFTTKILGTEKEISVESADLKVIFTSGSGTINGTNIEPGWTSGENTFTVKNESNGTYKYNIIIKALVNTFVTEGFLQYKITSTDGGYNMTDFEDVPKSSTATDTILAENISIEKGATHTYKIVINYNNSDDVDQSADMGKMLTGKIFITKANNPTLLSKLLEDNPTISTRTDFSTVISDDTTGTIFKTNESEDGSMVYYYSGNTTNNWIKFGKEEVTECTYNGQELFYPEYHSTVIDTIGTEISEVLSARRVREKSECTSVCTSDYYVGMTGLNEEQCKEFFDSEATFIENGATLGKTEEKDVYWRIIRTNENGSIRLLYFGLGNVSEQTPIGYSNFSDTVDKDTTGSFSVGYMTGNRQDYIINEKSNIANMRKNENSSVIKNHIDTWYVNNLFQSYDKYIDKDTIYCNDRSGDEIEFNAYKRIDTNKKPSYKCGGNGSGGIYETTQSVEDKFNSSGNNGGNGKLKCSVSGYTTENCPLALMTADEVVFAAGVQSNSNNILPWITFINDKDASFTMTPFSYDTEIGSQIYVVDDSGVLTAANFSVLNLSSTYAVHPVTSLKSCVQWKSGDGSASSPYEIVENGGC